jgi:cytoskeletal protein RodZ
MKLGLLRFTLAASVFLVMLCSSAVAQAQNETPAQQSSGDASNAQSQTSAQTDKKQSDSSAQTQPAPSKPMTPAEARQAQLLADTQKLYQLTQELKAEVAKSNKDTLSISVIKKAEEVEKLAKSLKEKMRAAR